MAVDRHCDQARDYSPVHRWKTAVCYLNTPSLPPEKWRTQAWSTPDGPGNESKFLESPRKLAPRIPRPTQSSLHVQYAGVSQKIAPSTPVAMYSANRTLTLAFSRRSGPLLTTFVSLRCITRSLSKRSYCPICFEPSSPNQLMKVHLSFTTDS